MHLGYCIIVCLNEIWFQVNNRLGFLLYFYTLSIEAKKKGKIKEIGQRFLVENLPCQYTMIDDSHGKVGR